MNFSACKSAVASEAEQPTVHANGDRMDIVLRAQPFARIGDVALNGRFCEA